jgi:hypothetical protein
MGFSNYPSGKVPIPRLENNVENEEFTKAKRKYAAYISALIRTNHLIDDLATITSSVRLIRVSCFA